MIETYRHIDEPWKTLAKKTAPIFRIPYEFAIAGGWVRAHFSVETPGDVDLWFRTEGARAASKEFLIQKGAVDLEPHKDAEWLSHKVQGKSGLIYDLCHYNFGQWENLISRFDLVCNMCAVTIHEVYAHPKFVTEATEKLLNVNIAKTGTRERERVEKLKARGFRFHNETAAQLAEKTWRQAEKSPDKYMPERGRKCDYEAWVVTDPAKSEV